MIRKWSQIKGSPEQNEWDKCRDDPEYREMSEFEYGDIGAVLVLADWCADHNYPFVECYWRMVAAKWLFRELKYEVPEELQHLFAEEEQ